MSSSCWVWCIELAEPKLDVARLAPRIAGVSGFESGRDAEMLPLRRIAPLLLELAQLSSDVLDVPAVVAAGCGQIRLDLSGRDVALDRADRQPERTGELRGRQQLLVGHRANVCPGRRGCDRPEPV
jgi:hypothetical protein